MATDPPYPREFLPVFSELAVAAARLLRPGGSLFAMFGRSYLPDVMARFGRICANCGPDAPQICCWLTPS